jgi:hypothetical protein
MEGSTIIKKISRRITKKKIRRGKCGSIGRRGILILIILFLNDLNFRLYFINKIKKYHF